MCPRSAADVAPVIFTVNGNVYSTCTSTPMTGVPPDALVATGSVSVFPARSTVSVSTEPAGCAVIIELSEVCPVTGLPSTASITSPAFRTLLAG